MVNLKETNDYSYALELALKNESETKEFLEEKFNSNLYKLWDVYVNEKRSGVVMSFKFDTVYTLDGYNETKNFVAAVLAGLLACMEIFKVTDTIITIHLKIKKRVTMLAKEIGFKEYKTDDDYIFLKKEKSWA